MKSLALFLITIVLIIIGMRLLSSEYVEADWERWQWRRSLCCSLS